MRLSDRGEALLASSPMPRYLLAHFERAHDRWSPENPAGYVPLCVAENGLSSEQLSARLDAVRVPPGALSYQPMTGSLSFREALSAFLGPRLLGRVLSPEDLVVLAGAGSVLEQLFHVLADPGDAVLVPTPSYAGFWADLETRDGLHVVPVPRSPEDGWALSTDALDAALEASERPVKALLFTHPDNPLGRVASADELDARLDWGRRRGVHVVFDEVYGLSTFGDAPFVSAASRPGWGEHAHVVWAFSKDFGASGLRCGVLASGSERVTAAVGELAYWAAVSGDTQARLEAVLRDEDGVDAWLHANRRRLGEASAAVSEALAELGVRTEPAGAGFFLWCDLRPWLTEPDFAAEEALWERLLDHGVNLTPGLACRAPEPGWFRLCFAALPRDGVLEGVRRVGAVLG